MTLLAPAAGVLSFLCLMALVAIVVAAIMATAAAARTRDEGLKEVARRLKGQFHPGRLSAYPELDFSHLGRTVTLRYTPGGEDESPRTLLTTAWNDRRLRVEIFPESPLSALRKLMGMHDIEIGSPDFDRQFIISGNDEAAIKALLTPEAQARLCDLLNLYALNSAADLYLLISGGRLTITKGQYLTSVAALERFVELFQQFCEAANAIESVTLGAGIEFVDAASPAGSDKNVPLCIVCGEPMTSDLVTCRSCRTPHHKDCWQYFGGCATYACGGKAVCPCQGFSLTCDYDLGSTPIKLRTKKSRIRRWP